MTLSAYFLVLNCIQIQIVFEFSKEKDTAVTKTSEAPSSVTTTTEEEKGNVKFAVGTTFNREKTGD